MSVCTMLVVGFFASINLAVPLLAAGSLHPTSAQLLLVGGRSVPALVTRVGVPAVLGAAFLITGVALFGLADTVTDAYPAYACWLVLFGIGFMLAVPCLTAEISAALPREQAGIGAGLQSTTRELGSALGVAVVGRLLASRFVAGLPDALRGTGRIPHTVAAALSVAGPQYHRAVISSFTAGSSGALQSVGLVVLAVGALITAQLLWSRAHGAAPESPAPKPPTPEVHDRRRTPAGQPAQP